MKDIAILGLGLMGGSLGLAVKQRMPRVTVHGCTRQKARGEMALERGAIDRFYTDPAQAVASADVIICCAPILAIPDQVRSVAEALKPGAVVTDVGSTKAVVQGGCADILQHRDAIFIGSHPIAGSEQQGMEAARADLYQDALVVVTPGPDARPGHRDMMTGLWRGVGGCVVEMSPDEHDQVLAATSHLPHVVASVLAAVIGRAENRPDWPRFCGTGYRDTTRIAEGGVDIWMDILKTNRHALTAELKVFSEKLRRMIEKLEQEEFSGIERALNEGKTSRQVFIDYGTQTNSED